MSIHFTDFFKSALRFVILGKNRCVLDRRALPESRLARGVESLESRRLFDLTIDYEPGGIVRVWSDEDSDIIDVVQVVSAGSTYPVDYVVNGVRWEGSALKVFGRRGDDTIILEDCQNSDVYAGPGDDSITLERGSGVVVHQLSPGEVAAGESDDAYSNWFTVIGHQGGSLTGANGPDDFDVSGNCNATSFYGLGGQDVIDCQTASGRLSIYGDAGNDFLYGGAGDDIIVGGSGNDWMVGRGGDDQIYAADGVIGNDVVKGDGNNAVGDYAQVDSGGESLISGIETLVYV